jgi:hypothetical protein
MIVAHHYLEKLVNKKKLVKIEIRLDTKSIKKVKHIAKVLRISESAVLYTTLLEYLEK